MSEFLFFVFSVSVVFGCLFFLPWRRHHLWGIENSGANSTYAPDNVVVLLALNPAIAPRGASYGYCGGAFACAKIFVFRTKSVIREGKATV